MPSQASMVFIAVVSLPATITFLPALLHGARLPSQGWAWGSSFPTLRSWTILAVHVFILIFYFAWAAGVIEQVVDYPSVSWEDRGL